MEQLVLHLFDTAVNVVTITYSHRQRCTRLSVESVRVLKDLRPGIRKIVQGAQPISFLKAPAYSSLFLQGWSEGMLIIRGGRGRQGSNILPGVNQHRLPVEPISDDVVRNVRLAAVCLNRMQVVRTSSKELILTSFLPSAQGRVRNARHFL